MNQFANASSRHPKQGNGKKARIPRREINAVVKRTAEKFDPERIILFGSYAYGKPHQYSDVDLLVVMKTKERPRTKQIEISRALSPHPFGMDILVRAPDQIQERIAMGDYFLREIVTEGKILYERHSRGMDSESRG
ncbi:MAG: nucleotidyltransferase domain-containing protein [Chloroflexi bacterium]|nr:nucleotidyltransferase domain-containing protein [Chloroflexota bacterium]